MTTQTIEQAVEEFGNQFDELNMKPPKKSMPGLERELLKDFMRKALQAQRDAGAKEERERVTDILEGMQVREVGTKNSREFRRYKNDVIDYALAALTPPTK